METLNHPFIVKLHWAFQSVNNLSVDNFCFYLEPGVKFCNGLMCWWRTFLLIALER